MSSDNNHNAERAAPIRKGDQAIRQRQRARMREARWPSAVTTTAPHMVRMRPRRMIRAIRSDGMAA